MYARVTLIELDTVRISVDAALAEFRAGVLPLLQQHPGYRGLQVLVTDEGRALLMSLWDTAEAADASPENSFYSKVLADYAMLFKAPPGRERYEVVLSDLAVDVRD